MAFPWELYESPQANCQVCYDLDPKLIPVGASVIRPGYPPERFCLRQVRLQDVLKEGGHLWMAVPGAVENECLCTACMLMAAAFRKFFHQDFAMMMDDPGVLVYIEGTGDGSMPVRVRLMHEKLDTGASWSQMPNTREQRDKLHLPDFGLELYTSADQCADNYPALGVSLDVSRDFRSDVCLAAVQGWIKDCLDNHSTCQASSHSPLPKRVVDVGSINGTRPPFVYITRGEDCKYAALSHCWGKARLQTTTKSTLEARTRGLDWDDLSKTFQESIMITRDLGLQYLWIDSLCIIQDNADDWEEQAMKMGEIYASAYITISATGALDGSLGLLRAPGTVEFQLKPSSGIKEENSRPWSASTRVLLEEEAFVKGIQGSRDSALGYPLLTRAWCFQERILSKRVLHYTPGGVLYECRTGSRCETRTESRTTLKSFYSTGLPAAEAGVAEDRLQTWGRMLEDYTTKAHTFRKDTLPALSSVASQMGIRGMGRYLAGLWEEGLIYGLLWEAKEDLNPNSGASESGRSDFSRPQSFIAPTFSWASRLGPIRTLNQGPSNARPCASVMAASCTPKGRDTYGMVSSGSVKILGRLVEAVFHPKACGFGRCADLYRRACKNSDRGTHMAAESPEQKCHIVDTSGEFPLLDIVVDSEQEARLPAGEKVYCLQLVEFAESAFGTWFEATENILDKYTLPDGRPLIKHQWRPHFTDDGEVELHYQGRWAPGYHSPIRRRSSSMLRHRYRADRDAGLMADETEGEEEYNILKLGPDDFKDPEQSSARSKSTDGQYSELSYMATDEYEEWVAQRGPAGPYERQHSPLSFQNMEDSEEQEPISVYALPALSPREEQDEIEETADQAQSQAEEVAEDEVADAGLPAPRSSLRTADDRSFLTAASEDGTPSSTSGVLVLQRSSANDSTYTRMAANWKFPTKMFEALLLHGISKLLLSTLPLHHRHCSCRWYRPRHLPGSDPALVPPPKYGEDGRIEPPRFPLVKSREEQIVELKRSSGTISILSGKRKSPLGSWAKAVDQVKDQDNDEEVEAYDLLVIDGGATGSGIALDAATRGLKEAMVDRDDFASGTSSKSTKLVHEGVRYLEKAVYKLVREALRERKYFLDTAPHLFMWLPIMIPVQKWWQAPYSWAGTKFYDLLAGSKGIEGLYFLTKTRDMDAFPMLRKNNLWEALVYYGKLQHQIEEKLD